MVLNRVIHIVLGSKSKLFLEATRKFLEDQANIRIAAEALNVREVKKYLTETKPDVLLVHSITLKLNMPKLLDIIAEKSPDTNVILFGNNIEGDIESPRIIHITKEITSSELIQIIKDTHAKKVVHLNNNNKRFNLTNAEAKIIGLISAGFDNQKVAKKLSISEKTLKMHLSHIFKKLEVKSRYQLMVYEKRLRRRNKPPVTFLKEY